MCPPQPKFWWDQGPCGPRLAPPPMTASRVVSLHCELKFFLNKKFSHCVACLNFVAMYISPNRVILAGRNGSFECNATYSPPYWHYYSLTPGSKPCSFGSYSFYKGISGCPSSSRISVTYSPTQRYNAILTISRARLSDAGTYTCGGRNPQLLRRALSVIVGVIGMCTLWFHHHHHH